MVNYNCMTLKKMAQKAMPILKDYKIKRASVFGSYARGEQKRGSDFDLLVQTPKGMSLFGLLKLERDLKKKLGVDVDVVTFRSIHHLLAPFIKKDEIRIL